MSDAADYSISESAVTTDASIPDTTRGEPTPPAAPLTRAAIASMSSAEMDEHVQALERESRRHVRNCALNRGGGKDCTCPEPPAVAASPAPTINEDIRGERCPRCNAETRRHVTGPLARYCSSCDLSYSTAGHDEMAANPAPDEGPRVVTYDGETPESAAFAEIVETWRAALETSEAECAVLRAAREETRREVDRLTKAATHAAVEIKAQLDLGSGGGIFNSFSSRAYWSGIEQMLRASLPSTDPRP